MGDNPSVTLQYISSKLNEEVLNQFLIELYGKDVLLKKYYFESGCAKGDSYLSSVFRIKVEGTISSNSQSVFLPLIVKCLPKCLARRKTFRSDEFFVNEVAFYNQVVPEFSRFQNKQKPKHPFTEFPRCFLAIADGENDVVVMEDMSHKGFKTASRNDGLNYGECELIVKVLGRFHALSFAMKDKEPEIFQKIASSLYETYYKAETRAWYIDQMQLLSEIAIDAVTKELQQKLYEERLQHFTNNSLFEKMCNLVKPQEPYSAITHGDAWAPNFLLKYSSHVNEIEEICLIDYQLTRYASPILDVSFFLYSCASRDVMNSHFSSILDVYYNSLCAFICDLGSSPETLFPYKDFQKEVSTYFCFGLAMSLESVPLSSLDESDTPDVESMVGDEAVPLTQIWALKPIENKDGRLRLALNIKHAVDNSYI